MALFATFAVRQHAREGQSVMSENARRHPRPSSEAGFALVLAILALMLLTFLGLTLATTTSTELQIATNYRWSQQALYNAEAGIEAGKLILTHEAGTDWSPVIPTVRTGVTWRQAGPAPAPPALPAVLAGVTVDASGNPLRNWENAGCDQRGGSVGFGVILNDTGTDLALGQQGPVQYKTAILGQNLNGATTVWVRRGFTINNDGTFQDDPSSLALVLTAEGVAPYTAGNIVSAFAQVNRATRTLEVSLLRAAGGNTPCEAYKAQAGAGVSGSGFAVCGALKLDCTGGAGGQESGLLSGALGNTARAAGQGGGGNDAIASGAAGTFGSKPDPANPGQCVQ
jgi:hypothetical protein